MLTFLRKIRKSLIESPPGVALATEEGSARKYLLYAIGEIALVVIGILIALQINNWNIYSQERAQEREYLSELRRDLVSDTLMVKNVLRNANDHIRHATYVLNFLETGEVKDTVKLIRSTLRAGFLVFYNANLSTYNDLINSGNIRLIRDNEIKRKLDSYVNYLQQINVRYELSKKKVWEDYGDYSRSKYVDGRLREIAPRDSLLARQYPVDWKKMASDPLLKPKLSWVIGNAQAELRWHAQTKQRVLDMIDHLDTLLEK